MTTAAELIVAARGWLDVPWHHQGRSRLGVDCVGLIECALAETVGLPEGYRTPRNYGRTAVNDALLEHLEHWCERSDPAPGTVVAIRYRRGRPSHIGLLTGPTLIHAYQLVKPARVIEQSWGEPWTRRLAGAWRLPGVEYA
jgi:cell wall-associated NlpC family hydrolase